MSEKQIRALIVDDDEQGREELARWLRRAKGFEVNTVTSGEEAVSVVRQAQGDYDALLIDQTLPAMTGIETMKRLRVDYPALPVLVFTGRDPDAGVEALRQGAYRYLLKPFRNEELAMTIQAMAEARRQQVHARETGWLQSLLRIAQNAMTMPKETLLHEVATAARDLLSGVVSIIWTLDRTENRFRVAAWAGELDDDYRAKVSIDAQAQATGKFLERRQPIYLPDVTDPERAPFYTEEHRAEAQERGWVSLLSAPLIAGEQVIGILDVYTDQERGFLPEERDLLSTFANQAAIAIENAQLVDTAHIRRQNLERLVEIGEIVTRETTAGLKPMLEKVAANAHRLTGADYVAIYPFDADRQTYDLENVVIHGLAKIRIPKERPRQKGMAALVRTLGELVVHDVYKGESGEINTDQLKQLGVDETQLPELIRSARFIQEEGVKAFVGLSLKARGKSNGEQEQEEVGVLYIDFCRPHRFAEEELRVIRIFGHQVASAMLASRLLHREQQRLVFLGDLQDTLSDILARHEPAKVAEMIATSASQLMTGERGHKFQGAIWLCDHETRTVRVEHSYNKRLVGITLKFGEGLAGWVVENRQPRYINDYHAWEERAQVFDEDFRRDLFASVIEVPLFWEETVIGVLAVSSPEFVEFDDEDIKLLERFSGRAAIAIYNANLFEDAQRRIRDLEIITRTVEVMSTKLDTSELLQTIVSEVANQLECTHCTLFFPQKEDGELLLVPQVTHGTRSEVMTRRFRQGEGLVGWVFQQGESVFLADARDDDRFAPARDEQDLPRSMLVAPVKVGDQTVGVISADQDAFGWFGESDRRLVDALAGQAGIAIERAIGLELLQDIGNRITSTRDVDEVLQQIILGAIKLTNTTSGMIYLMSEDKKSVTKTYLHPPDLDHPEPRIGSEGGLTRTVIANGEVLLIPDISQDSRVNPALHDRVRSMIVVPLKVEQGVIGVLFLNDADPHNFTDTEVSLLVTLASQAAIAIENSRLFEELARTNRQLDRRVEELEVLTEIGRTVSNLGIDEILDLVYEQAGKIMDLSDAQVQIAFYDEAEDKVTFPLAVEQDNGEVIDVVRWSKRESEFREEGEDEVVKQFKPRPRGTRFGLTEYVINVKEPVLLVDEFRESVTPSEGTEDGTFIVHLDAGEDDSQEGKTKGVQVWHRFGRLDRPTNSWLGVPMIVQDRVIGIISVQSLGEEPPVDKSQLAVLEAVANQAAVAIENARLYQQLNEKIEELEHAQKKIAETEAIITRTSIAADFVHRLNNLAGTIPIWVDQVREYLSLESLGDEVLVDYLDRIESDTYGLLRAAEQLKSPPEEQDVDIGSVLKALVRQALVQTPVNVEVYLECEETLPVVRTVRTELANALWSIMENGIEAMPDGGTLTIKAEDTVDTDGKEWTKIQISDKGSGIVKEEFDKVFSPFYSTRVGHMGYGLWRAKNVIERVGGGIVLESEEGLGTTFIVTLPTSKEAV